MVQDRATKTPFSASKKLHSVIKATALRNGLMCYPMGGTIDGQSGDHVLLAPPLVISNQEIDQAVSIFATSLDQAIRDTQAIKDS